MFYMVHGVFYVVWCGGRWCPLFLISNFPRCPPRAHVTWPVLPLLQRLLTIHLFSIYGTIKLWTHSVVEHFLCYCSSAFLISVQFPRGGIGGSFDRFLSKTKQLKITQSPVKDWNIWGRLNTWSQATEWMKDKRRERNKLVIASLQFKKNYKE